MGTMADLPFLPYGKPVLDRDDIEAVTAVLESDFLTMGPQIGAFEQAFAETTAAPHAVACSNGTAALHLATMALGIGPGDTVVVPAITFLATANAVRMTGGEVVFADVDPTTGLMLPDHVEEAAARAASPVKAVYPVHMAGRLVDMPAVAAMAAKKGWAIVEDSCHALGGRYRHADGSDGRVGDCRYADMAVFSFHPTKTISSGEGGMITCRDAAMRDRMLLLRNHGMTKDGFVNRDLAFDSEGAPNPWYYEMQALGFNYRLSEIHCALGLSQTRKLDRIAARRREMRALYDERLAPLAPTLRTVGDQGNSDAVLHLYLVHIDFAAVGMDRAAVMNRLKAAGIGTQVLYTPVAWQPYYRARYGMPDLPGAAAFYGSSLALPFYNGLSDADIDRVVDTVTAVIGN